MHEKCCQIKLQAQAKAWTWQGAFRFCSAKGRANSSLLGKALLIHEHWSYSVHVFGFKKQPVKRKWFLFYKVRICWSNENNGPKHCCTDQKSQQESSNWSFRWRAKTNLETRPRWQKATNKNNQECRFDHRRGTQQQAHGVSKWVKILGEPPFSLRPLFISTTTLSPGTVLQTHQPSSWLTSYGIFIKICGRNKAGGEETTLSSQHEKTHSINDQIQPAKYHNPPDLVKRCPKLQI